MGWLFFLYALFHRGTWVEGIVAGTLGVSAVGHLLCGVGAIMRQPETRKLSIRGSGLALVSNIVGVLESILLVALDRVHGPWSGGGTAGWFGLFGAIGFGLLSGVTLVYLKSTDREGW